MPYKLSWYIQDRIIYCDLWGSQTLNEIQESSRLVASMLESATAEKVHLVVNDSRLDSVPTNLSALQEVLIYGRHPKLGWVIAVGTTKPIIKFLLQMMVRIFNVRFHRVLTFEEAQRFLQQQDKTLNWAEANPSVVVSKSAQP